MQESEYKYKKKDRLNFIKGLSVPQYQSLKIMDSLVFIVGSYQLGEENA